MVEKDLYQNVSINLFKLRKDQFIKSWSFKNWKDGMFPQLSFTLTIILQKTGPTENLLFQDKKKKGIFNNILYRRPFTEIRKEQNRKGFIC